jgi:hypothetical protein
VASNHGPDIFPEDRKRGYGGGYVHSHIKNQGSFLNPEELLKKHEVA